MNPTIVHNLLRETSANGQKLLAVLIDPDKAQNELLDKQLKSIERAGVGLIFFGGSLLTRFELDERISYIKQRSAAKVVLFPGSAQQISPAADAILFLSLISGRNPDLLIGQHVLAAPHLRQTNLEILPTGYMLIDGGKPTTASYISGTLPLPADKPDIAMCTAMAGEMLGLRQIYMDAGSGAQSAISTEMIRAVRANVSVPLIVGGGMRTPQAVVASAQAGADVLVVGNATEHNPSVIDEMMQALKNL